MSTPEIIVERDFDGFFGRLVKKLVEAHKGKFHHKQIRVTAGPWRSSAVSYVSQGDVLCLDFYSPLRNGFGTLSREDLDALTELL